jgi:N-acetylmuramoyl-L-alanine amidase
MNITPDHWLDPVNRQLIPGGGIMEIRRFLVIHFTDGATALSSVSWWRNPKAKGANAHVVIDRDGTIYQCRPFNRTCGHAGPSKWKDPNTGITYLGLNTCSIGIELANGGCDEPGPDGYDWAKKQPWFKGIKAAHKNGGPVVEWEAYPQAQLDACFEVSKLIVARYKLDDVVGHDDISPGRKIDPGPAFPMAELRAAVPMNRTR